MLRFPLGDLPKSRVRAIASERALVTADKPDSQDICFVSSGHYSDLVARLLPEAMREGDIVDAAGTVLGRHTGIANYTIGQRKGLGGSLRTGADNVPFFVTRIEPAQRRVVVGPREALQTSSLVLRDVNWLGDGPLEAIGDDGLELFVRTRSARPPVPARLVCKRDAPGRALVIFPAAENAVAPGQACVFYASDADGARVLGGGTVSRLAEARPDAAHQLAAAS